MFLAFFSWFTTDFEISCISWSSGNPKMRGLPPPPPPGNGPEGPLAPPPPPPPPDGYPTVLQRGRSRISWWVGQVQLVNGFEIFEFFGFFFHGWSFWSWFWGFQRGFLDLQVFNAFSSVPVLFADFTEVLMWFVLNLASLEVWKMTVSTLSRQSEEATHSATQFEWWTIRSQLRKSAFDHWRPP